MIQKSNDTNDSDVRSREVDIIGELQSGGKLWESKVPKGKWD